MNRILVAATALFLAGSVHAQNSIKPEVVQAISYPDGVLFEAADINSNFELTVAGTAGSTYRQHYSASGALFVDVVHAEGGALPDGLYKYESITTPSLTISREESSKMPDRNDLSLNFLPQSSSVSGSFRVLDGEVVDPTLEEKSSENAGGDE